MVHLNTDGLEPLQMTHRVCSKFYSADTGGFLLLEGFPEPKTWPQNLQSLITVSDLHDRPHPLRIIPYNQYIHPPKDRLYMLECKHNSIDNKFQSFLKDSSLPAHQVLESIGRVRSLTVFPWTVGWPGVWLLLGDDCFKPLRMLLQPTNGEPPVLKTLMVSWVELKERLETTLVHV